MSAAFPVPPSSSDAICDPRIRVAPRRYRSGSAPVADEVRLISTVSDTDRLNV